MTQFRSNKNKSYAHKPAKRQEVILMSFGLFYFARLQVANHTVIEHDVYPTTSPG